jgi:hypothetical protein
LDILDVVQLLQVRKVEVNALREKAVAVLLINAPIFAPRHVATLGAGIEVRSPH